MNTILRLWEQEDIGSTDNASGVIVIGAGKFGLRALKKLSERHRHGFFTVVDNKKEALDLVKSEDFNCTCIHADGIEYLVHHPLDEKTWIIPALPLHLAYLWLRRVLSYSGREIEPHSIPDEMTRRLPNVLNYDFDCIFTSNATFICPDYCSEPDEVCTYTKKSRKPDLFSVITDSVPARWWGAVLRSYQLAPGVGGYPAGHLYRLKSWAERLPAGQLFVVATACRCHGVVHAARVLK